MEEIKVGDFIRTKQGIISKVLEIDDIFAYVDREVGYIEETGTSINYIQKRIVTKHNPNIIDVIEVGDYVNGYKVSFIDKDYKPFVQCDYPVQAGTTNHYRFYKEAIYSIVTHESFNSIKYEVI